MRLALPSTLVAALMLAGCGQSTPEQAARDSGLMPPQVDAVLSAAQTETITNPYLRSVRESLADVRAKPFPTLPARPDYATFFTNAARPLYRGWDTDRIDASSYDSLTQSLNAILQQMGPEQAAEFDKIAKYVMMNVTRDPMVAKKAVGGGQVSDAEILQVMQSYLHDRTPKEVTELASRLMDSQQAAQRARQGRQQGGAPAMPSGDVFGPTAQ